MDNPTPQLVPKVHPASRGIEPDDPMSIHATAVPGDPDVMFRAVVQEFGGMGWDFDAILGLFQDPFFPVLNGVWLAMGEDEVRRRIASVIDDRGVHRFRCTVVEAEEEPDLVPLLWPTAGPGRQGEVRDVPGV